MSNVQNQPTGKSKVKYLQTYNSYEMLANEFYEEERTSDLMEGLEEVYDSLPYEKRQELSDVFYRLLYLYKDTDPFRREVPFRDVWAYELPDEEIAGVVSADCEEEAKQKVIQAYRKQFGPDFSENPNIRISRKEENGLFSVSPDVIEIDFHE